MQIEQNRYSRNVPEQTSGLASVSLLPFQQVGTEIGLITVINASLTSSQTRLEISVCIEIRC